MEKGTVSTVHNLQKLGMHYIAIYLHIYAHMYVYMYILIHVRTYVTLPVLATYILHEFYTYNRYSTRYVHIKLLYMYTVCTHICTYVRMYICTYTANEI